MNRGNILLRVDGSNDAGMGRVARCVALANALQRRRYQMTFISQMDNPGWPERIRRFRHTIFKAAYPIGSEEDRTQVLNEIAKRSALVFITDSPEIDEEYLAMAANRVPLAISLEDKPRIRFPSDLILNPSFGHNAADFQLYPGSQLVSGDKYAMVRSEFRRARSVRATEPGQPFRVMIALGGGNVAQDTLAYTKALLKSKKTGHIECIMGTSPKGTPIDTLAEENPDRITLGYDVRDLGMRMTKAHLLITGGGTTALEGACVGIPTLIVVRRPEQKANADYLEEAGTAQVIGPRDKIKQDMLIQAVDAVLEDSFERKAMSRSGRILIDGRGGDRIVTATEILLRRSPRQMAVAA